MPFDRRVFGAIVLMPCILADCRHRDRDDASTVADARFSARDSTRTLRLGDVQISSTDSAVELAIIGDTIVAGLGKKVLDEVRDNTDTAEVMGNGFAASIERAVKSSVASVLNHQLLFPVADVGDVQSEDGKLVFYGKDGSKMHMFERSNRGRPNRQTLSDADARQFIAAFRARKAHAG